MTALMMLLMPYHAIPFGEDHLAEYHARLEPVMSIAEIRTISTDEHCNLEDNTMPHMTQNTSNFIRSYLMDFQTAVHNFQIHANLTGLHENILA